MRAQRPQRRGEVRQPRPADRAEGPAAAARPALGRELRDRVERVHDAALVDRVGLDDHVGVGATRRAPGHDRASALRRRGRAASSPDQAASACRSDAPSRVRAPVSRRMSASPRDGSCAACRRATRSTTSGADSSPPRPTTSTGSPASRRARRRVSNCDRFRQSTAAVTRSRPGPAGRHRSRDELRDRARLVLDASSATCACTRPSPAPGRAASTGTATRVADARSGAATWLAAARISAVVAPRGGQLVHVGGRARAVRVDLRERRGEPLQTARARSAPPVDRLVRVADRGHRVPAAEQRAEQGQLRVGRVLVLVEQHHPEPRALTGADLGDVEREPGGERDLVAEVDRVGGALAACGTRRRARARAPARPATASAS